MKTQHELRPRGQPAAKDEEQAAYQEANRAGQSGEADEPDAPTAEEENQGMSTVLSADPVIGVQNNASEE